MQCPDKYELLIIIAIHVDTLYVYNVNMIHEHKWIILLAIKVTYKLYKEMCCVLHLPRVFL